MCSQIADQQWCDGCLHSRELWNPLLNDCYSKAQGYLAVWEIAALPLSGLQDPELAVSYLSRMGQ